MTTKSCLLLLFFAITVVNVFATVKLREKFVWPSIDFEYPDEQSWVHALKTGDFIPENNLPVGIEVWKDKLFVTVPRWRGGIPSTLNYIPVNSNTPSPKLIPYPDWPTNRVGDCENGLTTVYRIKADQCDRLWVLDTGTFGIGSTMKNPCPYALNVFDLNTNKRIRRYVFRPEDTNDKTFIANIAVDIGKNCDDAFAYFSDELGYGLIAYSWEQNDSWRFSHNYFMPDPLAGDFNIAGLNFQWGEEGIFGIAISPMKQDGYRSLFFNPLASNREFVVSTKILRNKTRTEDSYHDFQALEERGLKGHVTASVMDDNGILYFNLIDQNSIGCWNSHFPYSRRYHDIIDRDDVGLVFPSDVKIDKNENIWVLSDRMPVFLIANLDYNDINFRIYTASLSEALEGTNCIGRAQKEGISDININQNRINQNMQSIYPEIPLQPFPTQPARVRSNVQNVKGFPFVEFKSNPVTQTRTYFGVRNNPLLQTGTKSTPEINENSESYPFIKY